jgi:hypothetical protein
MDGMKLATLTLAFAALAAAADSYSGTVVDVMCRHGSGRSHAGNARTLAMLKTSAKEKELKAKVSGSLSGDVLKVESIELQ